MKTRHVFSWVVMVVLGIASIQGVVADGPNSEAERTFFYNEDDGAGFYITAKDGQSALFEFWEEAYPDEAICVLEGNQLRCEEPFGGGYTLRRIDDGIVRETWSGSEEFRLSGGRYISQIDEYSYRELTTQSQGGGATIVEIIEWYGDEPIELPRESENIYAFEEEGFRLTITVESDQVTFVEVYDDGDRYEIIYTPIESRGTSIAAILPEPQRFPDLSRSSPTGRQSGRSRRVTIPSRPTLSAEYSLPEGSFFFDFSPDGDKIITVGSQGGYRAIDTDRQKEIELAIPEPIVAEYAGWSPSGRYLTYVLQSDLFQDGDGSIIDAVTGEKTLLFEDDYEGDTYDLPDGVYTEGKTIWVDERRLLLERNDGSTGTSLWLLEVEDPADWIDSEFEAAQLIGPTEMDQSRLWRFDESRGVVYLRSSRSPSYSGMAHSFLTIAPGRINPQGSVGEALWDRSIMYGTDDIAGINALIVIPPRKVVGDEVGPPQDPVLLSWGAPDASSPVIHPLLPTGIDGTVLDAVSSPAGDAIAIVYRGERSGQLEVGLRRVTNGAPIGPIDTIYRLPSDAEYLHWRPTNGRPGILWTDDHRLLVVTGPEGPIVELEL